MARARPVAKQSPGLTRRLMVEVADHQGPKLDGVPVRLEPDVTAGTLETRMTDRDIAMLDQIIINNNCIGLMIL